MRTASLNCISPASAQPFARPPSSSTTAGGAPLSRASSSSDSKATARYSTDQNGSMAAAAGGVVSRSSRRAAMATAWSMGPGRPEAISTDRSPMHQCSSIAPASASPTIRIDRGRRAAAAGGCLPASAGRRRASDGSFVRWRESLAASITAERAS